MEREELKLKITMNGQVDEIRFNDFTGLDARAFRQQVGVSLVDAFMGNPDVDILAGLVWLHRRKTKPRLSYEDVAGEFTYNDLIESRQLAEDTPEAEDGDGDVDSDDDPS